MAPDVAIVEAHDASQVEACRALFREYQGGLGVSLCFQGFDAELAGLPGAYAPPTGALLLARAAGQPAGAVGLRRLEPGICEMKRMFVYPQLHGKGIGRALAEVVINEARVLGYTSMRLDTSIRQNEAKTLYQRLGFQVIQPYYELPAELRNWLVFMELKL